MSRLPLSLGQNVMEMQNVIAASGTAIEGKSSSKWDTILFTTMKFFPLLFDIVSCCISWAGKENVSTGQTAIGRLMDLNHSHMWLCLVLIMLTNVTTHSKNQNFFFSLLRPVCDMVRMQSSKYDLEPLVSNCPLN